jgi:hypothetical protein
MGWHADYHPTFIIGRSTTYLLTRRIFVSFQFCGRVPRKHGDEKLSKWLSRFGIQYPNCDISHRARIL